ncbi:MAG: hypothetical protein K6C30_03620 [Bacteroidaceae bacterium]|nr:hypothetical protein [Bacteroidaceae bacterium]
MKLRYIIPLLVAMVMAVGCSDDNGPEYLDDLRVSTSFVSIEAEGGSTEITVEASEAWSIDEETIPEWLTVAPTSGEAGQTTVSFSAPATSNGLTAYLKIVSGTNVQDINVVQGQTVAEDATCLQAIQGADGKTFRLTGAITRWGSNYEKYGNCYISDGTGEIQIYGMADRDGKLKNNPVASWGLEVGDVITVEGPKSTYKGEAELLDVTVLKVSKSLVSIVEPTEAPTIAKEGGDLVVKLAYKGKGVLPELEEGVTWLRLQSMRVVTGTASAVEPNPADTAYVTFVIDANSGEGRKSTVNFSCTNGTESSSLAFVISQEAFVLPHGQSADDPFSVAEAIAKCEASGGTSDGVIYFAKGYISSIKEVSTSYGNATFKMSDDGTENGAITVFRSYSLDNQKFVSEDEIAVGDEVIVCGKLVNYTDKDGNVTPEFSGSVYVYSRKAAGPGSKLKPFSVDEALAFVSALEADKETEDDYYVAGEIVNIKYTFSAKYGTATFFIATDDDPANDQFQIYSCYYLGNRPWVDGDKQIEVGDQVVVCGRMVNYGGNTPETASKKAYIYSLNGQTE